MSKKHSGLALVTGGALFLSGCGSTNYKDSNDICTVEECPITFDNRSIKTVNEKPYCLSDLATTDLATTVTTGGVNTTSSNITSSSTTSSVNTTTTSLQDSAIVTTSYVGGSDIDPYNVGLEYSNCMYMRNKYFYFDSSEEYVVDGLEDLDSVCSNIGVDSIYDIWDFLPNCLGPGGIFSYPVKYEYYLAQTGESVSDISYTTGIDESVIRSLNSIPDDMEVFNSTGGVLLHVFKGSSSSYNTKKGVSHVVNNNKIFADKLVSIGEPGHEKLLGLLNDKYIYGSNTVSYYEFNGDGIYSTKFLCSNVIDIACVDGELAAYVRDDDYAYCMALSVGISHPDDFALSQFQTHYNYSYDIYFNNFLEPYIKCEEGRDFVEPRQYVLK